ncbi:alpha/beta fold hydrolase [Paenibacillus sp. HB172176]|uniref:dienelactone hydrolase family protein n=1 Tax=Paenibacillus sp. HB172176 TaxID=2493690 RepID=UPI00143987A1|nr:alpha/beta fold hydrolase [Paenibacillus sp. HB172176]
MRDGDAFLSHLYTQASEDHLRNRRSSSNEERREALRRALQQTLDEFERNEQVEASRLEEKRAYGDYTRERVQLGAVAGLSFPAYILRPVGASASERLPAVIAVHGHGYGSRQICGMKEDGEEDTGSGDIYRHFALQLVRRGFVVIAPDVIGFGERRLQADLDENPNAPSSCYRLSTELLLHGKTLAGLRVAEMLGVFDYAAALPDIDAERIGIVGFSGGSLIAYMAAALERRIKAAVLIGFPNTFKDSILSVFHCICNYVPGLLSAAELPELMGLIAPRPLFLESGERDPIFPAKGFRQAVQELQEIYRGEGAENSLGWDLFPGEHEVSGRFSFDWLVKELAITKNHS